MKMLRYAISAPLLEIGSVVASRHRGRRTSG
jgi:hypothetical protein